MTVAFRLLAVLLLGLLAACSPSSDKSPGDKSPAPSVISQGQLAPDQYEVLSVAQSAEAGDKVEVIEFFAYFCSHCRAVDPLFSRWAEQNAGRVVFKRVPVSFQKNTRMQQRMYYALKAMGRHEELQAKIFFAVQERGESLDSDQKVFDFVARHNVNLVEFKQVYNSFGVQSQSMNAQHLQAAYKIDAIPVVAIDGRFMTSATLASNRAGVDTVEDAYKATLAVMSDLVAKVRRERTNPVGASQSQK